MTPASLKRKAKNLNDSVKVLNSTATPSVEQIALAESRLQKVQSYKTNTGNGYESYGYALSAVTAAIKAIAMAKNPELKTKKPATKKPEVSTTKVVPTVLLDEPILAGSDTPVQSPTAEKKQVTSEVSSPKSDPTVSPYLAALLSNPAPKKTVVQSSVKVTAAKKETPVKVTEPVKPEVKPEIIEEVQSTTASKKVVQERAESPTVSVDSTEIASTVRSGEGKVRTPKALAKKLKNLQGHVAKLATTDSPTQDQIDLTVASLESVTGYKNSSSYNGVTQAVEKAEAAIEQAQKQVQASVITLVSGEDAPELDLGSPTARKPQSEDAPHTTQVLHTNGEQGGNTTADEDVVTSAIDVLKGLTSPIAQKLSQEIERLEKHAKGSNNSFWTSTSQYSFKAAAAKDAIEALNEAGNLTDEGITQAIKDSSSDLYSALNTHTATQNWLQQTWTSLFSVKSETRSILNMQQVIEDVDAKAAAEKLVAGTNAL
mgnify:CR=1 FL=1